MARGTWLTRGTWRAGGQPAGGRGRFGPLVILREREAVRRASCAPPVRPGSGLYSCLRDQISRGGEEGRPWRPPPDQDRTLVPARRGPVARGRGPVGPPGIVHPVRVRIRPVRIGWRVSGLDLGPEVDFLDLEERKGGFDLADFPGARADKCPGQRDFSPGTVDQGIKHPSFLGIEGEEPAVRPLRPPDVAPSVDRPVEGFDQRAFRGHARFDDRPAEDEEFSLVPVRVLLEGRERRRSISAPDQVAREDRGAGGESEREKNGGTDGP